MKSLLLRLLLCLGLGISLFGTPQTFASCDNPTSELEKVNCTLEEIRPDNAPNPLNIEDRSKENSTTATFASQAKDLIGIATGVLASFAGIFAVIMLLKHSVTLITSQGDKGKIGEARNGILYSLLGVAGIILAYSIVYTIIDVIYQQLGN